MLVDLMRKQVMYTMKQGNCYCLGVENSQPVSRCISICLHSQWNQQDGSLAKPQCNSIRLQVNIGDPNPRNYFWRGFHPHEKLRKVYKRASRWPPTRIFLVQPLVGWQTILYKPYQKITLNFPATVSYFLSVIEMQWWTCIPLKYEYWEVDWILCRR